jgi:hypothetical protein
LIGNLPITCRTKSEFTDPLVGVNAAIGAANGAESKHFEPVLDVLKTQNYRLSVASGKYV